MRRGWLLVLGLAACSACSACTSFSASEDPPQGAEAGAPDAPAAVASSLYSSSERGIRLHPNGHSVVDPNVTVVPATTSSEAAIGESGAADDSTYLSVVGTTQRKARFTKPALVLSAGAKITQLVVGARVRRGAPNPPTMSGLAIGLYFTERQAPLDPQWNTAAKGKETTYTIETLVLEKYPWGSPRAWTANDVDRLELLAIFDAASATNAVELTQLWLDVCVADP